MATAAAAAVAVARRKIVSHFMAQNAVAPAEAVAFTPERRLQRRQFERLQGEGVIVAAGDGRFWLNVPVYEQWRRRTRQRVGIAVALLTVVGAAAALLAG